MRNFDGDWKLNWWIVIESEEGEEGEEGEGNFTCHGRRVLFPAVTVFVGVK